MDNLQSIFNGAGFTAVHLILLNFANDLPSIAMEVKVSKLEIQTNKYVS